MNTINHVSKNDQNQNNLPKPKNQSCFKKLTQSILFQIDNVQIIHPNNTLHHKYTTTCPLKPKPFVNVQIHHNIT